MLKMNVANEFVDFSGYAYRCSLRDYLCAWNAFLCFMKTLEFVKVHETLAIPVIIFGGMLKKLISFFLIFVIVLCAFASFDYLAFGLKDANANTMVRSVLRSFRGGAVGDIDFDAAAENDPVVATLMLVVFVFIMVLGLMNLLIAVMGEAYEEVQETAKSRWCYCQFQMVKRAVKKTGGLEWLKNQIPSRANKRRISKIAQAPGAEERSELIHGKSAKFKSQAKLQKAGKNVASLSVFKKAMEMNAPITDDGKGANAQARLAPPQRTTRAPPSRRSIVIDKESLARAADAYEKA